MGLDAIDLCFCLEKQFGIKIGHDEAAAVFDTPGTLHRYLMAKLRGKCKTVPSIKPLYIEVAKAVGRLPKRWRLSCSSKSRRDLNKRIPPERREAIWKSLEEALGISLPSLEHPIGEQFFRIPPRYDTTLSLTYWIAANHPERVKEWTPVSCQRSGPTAERQWTDEEVWKILQDCIADTLGVKREKVTRDARMVEDLGME